MSATNPDQNLADLLESCALEAGFAAAGALDLALAAEAMAPHVARYDAWIRDGRAGAMQYLERGRDRRADPHLAFPEAQSVLCVALPYAKSAGGATSPAEGPRYARYIRGRDYHDEVAERLERAMRLAADRWKRDAGEDSLAGMDSAAPVVEPLRWKICVDTSAVLERSWAQLAGLGWIGKNTLLIHPQLGSYFFLGVVLLNHPTGRGPRPLPDYCGHCSRCLDGCPTRAITEPRWLDSRRCISYWTLEKRGELALSEEDKRAVGPWIAGCDVCQEVCPFNLKPVRAEAAAVSPVLAVSAVPAPSADSLHTWRELLLETTEQYRARVRDSSLSRIKPAQFSRNLALTLANAILAAKAAELASLKPLVETRLAAETDDFARAEWVRCLQAF